MVNSHYAATVEFCKDMFADFVLRIIFIAGHGRWAKFHFFSKPYLLKNKRLRYPRWSVYSAINR